MKVNRKKNDVLIENKLSFKRIKKILSRKTEDTSVSAIYVI